MTVPDLQPLVRYFETLGPESIDRLAEHYASDAVFKDPFNEVRGTEAIAAIFRHMFVQVESPRFVIGGRFVGDDGAMLLWDFHFRTRGLVRRDISVRGVSHLRFDAAGKVVLHRDYWDAAEELYSKLPLIGPVVRALSRAFAPPARPRENTHSLAPDCEARR
jgi:ketosteroid isomerase-like protein